MRGSSTHRSVFAVLSALLVAQYAMAARPPLVGRAVSSVLAELSDSGLRFIYSSELVGDSLVVLHEPRSRDRLRLVNEILAEHGLTARPARGRLYVIVPALRASETFKVHGRVLDAITGSAVGIARVELQPLGVTRVTDEQGRFSFDAVPTAQYRLRATAADYATVEANAAPASGTPADITLLLAPALAEVVVAASRYRLGADDDSAAHRLTRAQIGSQPSIGEDPLRSVSRLPGMARDGIAAAPNIRGGSADEVLVLLDGFPLRQVYHLSGYQSLFSVLDENVIDSAEIYTGGFGARYGNRLSGVFDLTSIDAAREPRNSLGVSFVNAHARMSKTFQRADADILAAARVGTLAPVLNAIAPKSDRPRYSDAFTRFTMRPTTRWTVTASALLARDALDIHDDDEHAQFESRSNYLWLRTEWSPAETLHSSTWLGRSAFDLTRVGETDKPEFLVGAARDVRHAQYTDLHSELEWRASEHHQVTMGVEWSAGSANYRYAGEARFGAGIAELFGRGQQFARDIALEAESRRFAAYVTDRWRMGERWVTELGLRAQRSSYSEGESETNVDPRMSVRVDLWRGTRLRFHWGEFHQADEASDLRVEDGVVAARPARRSVHAIVGIEHDWGNGLALRTELFRKRELQPRARFENTVGRLELFPELNVDRVRVAAASAEISGAEFSLSYQRDEQRAWLSLSRSTATDEFPASEVSRGWDQSWAAQLGGEWQRGRWLLSGAFAWHRGWPTTRIVTNEEGDAVLGARNGSRLPAFAELDLRGEYRRPLRHGSLVLSLEISNAANRRNLCCAEIEVEEDEDGEPVIFTTPQRGLPLLPSLGVTWEY